MATSYPIPELGINHSDSNQINIITNQHFFQFEGFCLTWFDFYAFVFSYDLQIFCKLKSTLFLNSNIRTTLFGVHWASYMRLQ